MPISDYFERKWLSPNSRFSREVWNQYNSVLTHQNRSNNYIEGFHSAFKRLCGGTNLNFWRYVDTLRSQQALIELSIVRYESGQLPAPRHKEYVTLDHRIFRVVSVYDILNAISYLFHRHNFGFEIVVWNFILINMSILLFNFRSFLILF